jgi:hypothetical protein
MQPLPANVPTVGAIARRLGQPMHRVEYVLRSRRLRPTGKAGNCRVFAEEDVQRVQSALAAIDRRKDGAA